MRNSAASATPGDTVPVPTDPAAGEQAAVAAWVDEATRSGWYEIPLKDLPSGRVLLAGDPRQSCRFIVAAVAETQRWNRLIAAGRAAQAAPDRIPATEQKALMGRWLANAVPRALLRRTLPFTTSELITILDAYAAPANDHAIVHPIGALVRALDRHVATAGLDEPLRAAMRRYATSLRERFGSEGRPHALAVERLCAIGTLDNAAQEPTPPADAGPLSAAGPAPAGSPTVFTALKKELGMLPADHAPPATVVEPDGFSLGDDSPLRHAHDLISALLGSAATAAEPVRDIGSHAAGQSLLALDPPGRGRAVLAAAERVAHTCGLPGTEAWSMHVTARFIMHSLLAELWELDREGRVDFLLYLVASGVNRREPTAAARDRLTVLLLHDLAVTPPTAGERFVLTLVRQAMITGAPLGSPADDVASLTRAIGDGAQFFLLPGEVWTDAVNADIGRLPAGERPAWIALLAHALQASASRPSARWLKTAAGLIEAVGADRVQAALARWLPLVPEGNSAPRIAMYPGDDRLSLDVMLGENAMCLRGLLWCAPLLPGRDELARAITAVAVSAYEKRAGRGPRAVTVGTAAVQSLSRLPSPDSVGQLSMLRSRLRSGTARIEIEKAFNVAAAALGVAREDVEEHGVPTYGLTDVGRLQTTVGKHGAELVVAGAEAELRWFDAAGQRLKSVPAQVRREHPDALEALRRSLADVRAMLPATRDRIDGLFLQRRSWPYAAWRERYHDHPLIGTIARRLLWCIDGTAVLFVDGVPTDLEGGRLAPRPAAEVTLWHPVDRGTEEIVGWRRRLEDLRIRQPFKQAHREIYLLTDAERRTGTYSNRYAAHVIRQHQFHALCGTRGWKDSLRLMVNETYPPANKPLPHWGLQAEFRVAGVGSRPGVDTSGTGTYLRLGTDQVRFYRFAAPDRPGAAAAGRGVVNAHEPLPLADIPPLVFSEIMRDVDLFVGVTSIGNDPTWQDGGPDGRHRGYWNDFAFGALSGTALTRREVLERVVPRMPIADRCSFTDRFLVVRGALRTYRIHCGSGNVLMEPDDRYLCIVPDPRTGDSPENLYLPFDGDATLSIIISKAVMLAADAEITDRSITSQINRR
jgi:hypothetical protein